MIFLVSEIQEVVFIMLIHVKLSTIVGVLNFSDLNNCWHFNIYNRSDELSMETVL